MDDLADEEIGNNNNNRAQQLAQLGEKRIELEDERNGLGFGACVLLLVAVLVIWKRAYLFKGLFQPLDRLDGVIVDSFVVRPSSTDDDGLLKNHYFQIVDEFSYRIPGRDVTFKCNLTVHEKFYSFDDAKGAAIAAIGRHKRLWVIPERPYDCKMTSQQRSDAKFEATFLFAAVSVCFIFIIMVGNVRRFEIEVESQQLQRRQLRLQDAENENVELILR